MGWKDVCNFCGVRLSLSVEDEVAAIRQHVGSSVLVEILETPTAAIILQKEKKNYSLFISPFRFSSYLKYRTAFLPIALFFSRQGPSEKADNK